MRNIRDEPYEVFEKRFDDLQLKTDEELTELMSLIVKNDRFDTEMNHVWADNILREVAYRDTFLGRNIICALYDKIGKWHA